MRSRKSFEQADDDHKEWVQAIGEFITSFGECEFWSYGLVTQLFGPEIAKIVGQQPLMQRLRFIRAAVRERKRATELRHLDALEGVMALADLRNKLAHNPPMISVYEAGADEDDLAFNVELVGNAGDLSVSLDAIKDGQQKARLFASELTALHHEVAWRRRADQVES